MRYTECANGHVTTRINTLCAPIAIIYELRSNSAQGAGRQWPQAAGAAQ